MATTYYLVSSDKNFMDLCFPGDYFEMNSWYGVKLCKCANGWKALFEAHYPYGCVKDMKHFLIQNIGKYKIYTENGKEFTYPAFAQEVFSWDVKFPKKPVCWKKDSSLGDFELLPCEERFDIPVLYQPFDHLEYEEAYRKRYPDLCYPEVSYYRDNEGYDFCITHKK